jgi:hypothetical protein
MECVVCKKEIETEAQIRKEHSVAVNDSVVLVVHDKCVQNVEVAVTLTDLVRNAGRKKEVYE